MRDHNFVDAEHLRHDTVSAPEGGDFAIPQNRITRRRQVTLRGISFDGLTEAEVVDHVLDAVEAGDGGWVSTPNIQQMRRLVRSEGERSMVAGASLVVPDGMPLIWASQLEQTPFRERVAGSDLVWSLAREAAARSNTLFLLGGDPGVAQRAEAKLKLSLPSLEIVGSHCPPFGYEDDPDEIALIEDALRRTQPDIVYVGLGFPKQERLILRLRTVVPDAWFLGIGVSLSFISGDHQRAPRWMQKTGLEWAHRLASEPSRLFRRYLLEGIPFTVSLLVRSWLHGRRRRDPGASSFR